MIVGSPAKWQEVLARRGSDRQGGEAESVNMWEKLWRVFAWFKKRYLTFGVFSLSALPAPDDESNWR
jgi:hypothetical protein